MADGLLAGATGQTSDTPWLLELLAGPDPILRWAAATALARLQPGAEALLAKLHGA